MDEPIIKAFFSMDDVASILASVVRETKGNPNTRYRCDLQFEGDELMLTLGPIQGDEPTAVDCSCLQCLANREKEKP